MDDYLIHSAVNYMYRRVEKLHYLVRACERRFFQSRKMNELSPLLKSHTQIGFCLRKLAAHSLLWWTNVVVVVDSALLLALEYVHVC